MISAVRTIGLIYTYDIVGHIKFFTVVHTVLTFACLLNYAANTGN